MKICITIPAILLSFIFSISIFGQSDFPELKGPYLGQKPPGMKAEIFAPSIISTELREYCISFSDDGMECFFVVSGSSFKGGGGLFHTRTLNNTWIEPQRFISRENQLIVYPHVFFNGKKIYFSSRWPEQEGESGFRIGIMSKVDDKWQAPQKITFGKNNESIGGGHVSVARNGNFYFQGFQEKDDIFMSKFENGNYLKPERLDNMVNSPDYEGHPCISPDESYLIFDAVRKDTHGKSDLYISFRSKDGNWTKAINMGKRVNSPGRDYGPYVTFDGRYIFFQSNRMDSSITSKLSAKTISYRELKNLQNSPGNGAFDIYWIDAKIIEELKPEGVE